MFIYNNGGRLKSGSAGDCVARAIAIASEKNYQEVWEYLAEKTETQRSSKRTKKRGRTADKGINVKRKWFQEYMESLGFNWVTCMGIGTGCKVHLRAEELPKGRLICSVSKHYVAVIDGVINDTHDPSRNGTRCVYGYWIKN